MPSGMAEANCRNAQKATLGAFSRKYATISFGGWSGEGKCVGPTSSVTGTRAARNRTVKTIATRPGWGAGWRPVAAGACGIWLMEHLLDRPEREIRRRPGLDVTVINN